MVQVVNEYLQRQEWRQTLYLAEWGLWNFDPNRSVQHCCNLCKTTKLNTTKAYLFIYLFVYEKSLILLLLAEVQLHGAVSELQFFFGFKTGKNQDSSAWEKTNDIYPHRGSCTRKFVDVIYCLKTLYSISLQCDAHRLLIIVTDCL